MTAPNPTDSGVSRITAVDLVQPVNDIFADLETRIASGIALRLAAGQAAPDWAQQKLAALGELRRFVRKLLIRAQRDSEDQILQALLLAYMRGGDAALKALAAYSDTLPEWVDLAGIDPGPRIQDALKSSRSDRDRKLGQIERAFPGVGAIMRMIRSLTLRIRGTHLPVLRWSEDAYREVISKTALPGILAGIDTRRRASQRAWEQLLEKGIDGFVDVKGRHWNLATYVEMATRSGAAQAAVEGHLDRLEAAGIELVIVSNAPQECEKCRPWEGKILSRTGPPGPRTVKVRSAISDDWITVHIAGTVAEAILAGLHHPQCRHTLNGYLAGATKIPTHTADPEGDVARQRLRALERRVRKEKLKAAAAITPAARKDFERRARAVQAQIREHVKATEHLGIMRKPERERIDLGNKVPETKIVSPPAPPKPTPVPAAKATKPKATKPPAAPKPAATKPASQNEFGDDYVERRMTRREADVRELQNRLLTAKADGAKYAQGWRDELNKELAKPNPNPADVERFRRSAEHFDGLEARLQGELADVQKSTDPGLEEIGHERSILRSGTPSPARVRASLEKAVSQNLGKQREVVLGELDRQATFSARAAVRLEQVMLPHTGTDVDYYRDNPGTMAFYTFADHKMTFSPRWASDPVSMQNSGRACYKSGWWTPSGVTDSMAGTCAHEYGHHMDGLIFGRGTRFGSQEHGRPLIAAIGKALGVKVNPKAAAVWEEIERVVNVNKAHLASVVSTYGSKNGHELLAEIWQEYTTMGDRARDHIKVVGKLMQKLADKGALD